MDALTIAFTKRSLIQYLNHLNARKNEADKFHAAINGIEEKETYIITDDEGNKKRVFKQPIPNFRQLAKEHLENVLVSHKAKNKVVTKNKNKIKTAKGDKVKTELTPRGQLHKETVYGKIKIPIVSGEKIGIRFNEATINCVSNPKFKCLLLRRLEENGNDPKKAFSGKNSLAKNPIYLGETRTQVLPEKIKLIRYENDYPTRKNITPDLKVNKVIDAGVRKILEERLKEYKGNAKEAFSDLDKNPIWLNKAKGISIKRVTISGVKNAEALHYKKDHFGKEILDENGNRIPVDFVSTGNNHHVAIYKDAEGNLQENVISFFQAVERVNQGIPIIDKTFNSHLGWQFLFTMKQNEYFVFPNEQTGFYPDEIDLLDTKNYKVISPNLFRVQKFSKVIYGNSPVRDYVFRHHLETSVEEKKALNDMAYKQFKSLGFAERIVKVRLNHIGEIVKVGEYS
jgi:CRISPR-associated endonuclease Csn1